MEFIFRLLMNKPKVTEGKENSPTRHEEKQDMRETRLKRELFWVTPDSGIIDRYAIEV